MTHRLLTAVVMSSIAVLPMTATAQSTAANAPGPDINTAFNRFVASYTVAIARFFTDISFDAMRTPPGDGGIEFSNVRMAPDLAWDPDGLCIVTVEQIVWGRKNTFANPWEGETEMSGVVVPARCFSPLTAVGLIGFGFDRLVFDHVSLSQVYTLSDGSYRAEITAEAQDALDVSMTIDLASLSLRFDPDGELEGDQVQPSATLREVIIDMEDRGLWERLVPMIESQTGRPVSALPDMITRQPFADPATGRVDPGIGRFLDDLERTLRAFLDGETNRLVVTLSPETPVALPPPDGTSNTEILASLAPGISSELPVSRQPVDPARLDAVLAGTAEADAAERMRVARALLSGFGAPFAPETAASILAPLVSEGDPAALALAAKAADHAGDAAAAYRLALAAMATGGGDAATVDLADRLEGALGLEAVLAAQAELADADETDLPTDMATLRRRAQQLTLGLGVARDYAAATYLSGLAAASGSRSAARLREQIDRQMRVLAGSNPDLWQSRAAEIAADVDQAWRNGAVTPR